MSQTEQAPPEAVPTPLPVLVSNVRVQLRPLLLGVPLLTLLTGVGFPLALATLARPFAPHQADGSLVARDGVVVGSELIGQSFSGPGYFHPRPSAAGEGYDGTASNGSNLGSANAKLRQDVADRTAAFRRANGLPPDTPVPIDAVTCSGSGLDPHISPANAGWQAPRVARARGLDEGDVRRLVAEYTFAPQLGFLGEPRVNVLMLNLALDRLKPLAPLRPAPPEG